jgi:hypothetical protein
MSANFFSGGSEGREKIESDGDLMEWFEEVIKKKRKRGRKDRDWGRRDNFNAFNSDGTTYKVIGVSR